MFAVSNNMRVTHCHFSSTLLASSSFHFTSSSCLLIISHFSDVALKNEA